MDTMSTMMGTGGSNLGLVGTGIKTGATIGGGVAAKQAADFEAAQYRQRAPMEIAAAQRRAMQRDATTAGVLGETKALAAASGGGVNTPTIADIMGGIAAKGSYQARGELYEGQVAANNDLNMAAAREKAGKNALRGSILEGISSGLTGAASYATKMFPQKTPTTDTDTNGDRSLLSSDDDYQTGWKTRTRSFG